MGLIRGAYGKVLLALAFASTLSAAHADFVVHPWESFRNDENRLRLLASGRFLSTAENFDANGGAVDVANQDGYSRIEGEGMILHSFSPRLTGFARLSWGLVTVTRATGTDSSFGLTDQTLGLSYRLSPVPQTGPGAPPSGLALDLQLQVDIPAYSAQPANNLPPLGDASVAVSGGGFATLPVGGFSNGFLRARAGAAFSYRSAGYASLIPWSAWLEYDPDPLGGTRTDPNGYLIREGGLLASLGAYGLVPVSTGAAPTQTQAAAQALATGSEAPSLISAAGRLGYRFTSGASLVATGGQTIWGQVAPKGFLAWLTLDLPLGQGGRTAPEKNPVLIAPKVYGAANKGFVNYSLEARVLRVSDRMSQIKVDRGTQDGVEVGQVFDIFVTKPDGTTGEGVARCKVISVRPQEASLSIVEYFREIWIDEGFVARRLIQ